MLLLAQMLKPEGAGNSEGKKGVKGRGGWRSATLGEESYRPQGAEPQSALPDSGTRSQHIRGGRAARVALIKPTQSARPVANTGIRWETEAG